MQTDIDNLNDVHSEETMNKFDFIKIFSKRNRARMIVMLTLSSFVAGGVPSCNSSSSGRDANLEQAKFCGKPGRKGRFWRVRTLTFWC